MIDPSPHPDGCILGVRAQPSSRTDAILGEHAGCLRVAVSAPPERGKANEAIARVLANAFGCPPSRVTLLSGQTSRQKRFLIAGLSPEELRQRLSPFLPPPDLS